ncbi:DNA-directed RNA polymerase [Dimargaris cristalligena]|nr:DNA-directed RNA polymerase [Dimargaris cristalligena]
MYFAFSSVARRAVAPGARPLRFRQRPFHATLDHPRLLRYSTQGSSLLSTTSLGPRAAFHGSPAPRLQDTAAQAHQSALRLQEEDEHLSTNSDPDSFAPASHTENSPAPGSTSADILAGYSPLILPFEAQGKELVFPGYYTLENQLALAHACLVSGDYLRARRMIAGLYQLHPRETQKAVDISIHNTLLNGLMEAQPRPQNLVALEWFDSLRKFKLSPTIDTYAIMIKGFLRLEDERVIKVLLEDLEKRNLQPANLLYSRYLHQSDVTKIIPLVVSSLGEATSATPEMDQFIELQRRLYAGTAVPDPLAPGPVTTSDTLTNPIQSSTTLGVQLLRSTLAALNTEQYSLYEKQIRVEQESVEASLTQFQAARESRNDPFAQLNITALKSHMLDWHTKITDLVEKEIFLIDRLDPNDTDNAQRLLYGPFLKAISPRKVALITILAVFEVYAMRGGNEPHLDHTSVTRAVTNITKNLESEYNSIQFRKKDNSNLIPRFMATNSLHASGKLLNMAVRKAMEKIEELNLKTEWYPKWPEASRARIGTLLLSFLLDTARLPSNRIDPQTGEAIKQNVSAFYHSYVFEHGNRIGVIKFSKEVLELLSRENSSDKFSPSSLPMVVPPRPWLTHESGGYLTLKSMAVRLKNLPDEIRYLRAASDAGRLNTILTGLDVLGTTPWRINRPVYEVVLEIWNSGEGLADIPPAKAPLEMPTRPSDYKTNIDAQRTYTRQRMEAQQAIANNHSLRCSANYKVVIAQAFLEHEFFFPHNLDFRGRAYPIPPHLNHMGDDLCRGLLHFAKGQPLGAGGLRWLRIQLANLYGFDKHSFDDREQFAIDHMDDIRDSALNPTGGQRWWLKAEDPWQCLATCFDLVAALDSPYPENYVSHLPIHQDGTCNGLQHYAALGCDRRGAEQVNLLPSDSPQDVYSGVLELVLKAIARDFEEGHELALLLKGRVNRRVIKQTVMTNVYGVTFVGAREQIFRRLREDEDVDPEKLFRCSNYLVNLVFESLGEIFYCARQIQDWLNEAARRISASVDIEMVNNLASELAAKGIPSTAGKSNASRTPGALPTRGNKGKGKGKNKSQQIQEVREHMNSVIWTTPLNLTVVQPYRNVANRVIQTSLQHMRIRDPTQAAPVNPRKQRTAFPPNFIHSLDASHMMLSAIECYKQELTFASVHDSYWTHACSVDQMNIILRDQFIALHEKPILENLLEEFKNRYGSHMTMVQREIRKTSKLKAGKAPAGASSLPRRAATDPDLDPSGTTPHSLEAVGDDVLGVDGDDPEALMGDDGFDCGASSSEMVVKEASPEDIESFLRDALDTNTQGASQGAPKKGRSKPLEFVPIEFPPLPVKGDFDIAEVAKSKYFFH